MESKRPKSYALLAILFLLVVLPLSVMAIFKGSNFFGVELNLLTADKYGTGVVYTPNCFTCHFPMEFKYNGTIAASQYSISSDNITWVLNKLNGDNLEATTLKILKNVSYFVNVDTDNTICTNTTDANGTRTDCPINITVTRREKSRWEWVNFSGTEIVKKNQWYAIDIIGTRSPNLGAGRATDIIPKILGFNVPEFVWWNSTFGYRSNITNLTGTFFPLSANGSYGVSGHTYWCRVQGPTDYVYSVSSGVSGQVACANDTSAANGGEQFWENESNRLGNSPASVWTNTSLVLHMVNVSGVINDSTYDNDTTNFAGVSTPGIFGDAIDFRRDNTAYLGTSGNVVYAYGAWSVAFWMNETCAPPAAACGNGGGVNPRFITGTTGGSGTYTFITVGSTSDGTLSVYLPSAGAWFNSTTIFNGNQWYFVVLTFDGAGLYNIYINGTLETTRNDSGADNDLTFRYIGQWGGVNKRLFNGSLDEFRTYTIALGQPAITALYDNGRGGINKTASSGRMDFVGVLGTEAANSASDTTAPAWSANTTNPSQPVAYAASKQYLFNVTWSGADVNTTLFEHNFTSNGAFTNVTGFNFTPSVFGFNFTDVRAGFFQWRSIANDTSNNVNATPYFSFSITNATPTLQISINGSTAARTITYPAVARADGNETNSGDTDLTYRLLRNGTQFATGSPATFGDIPGNLTYNFTYATNGGANYTTNYSEVLLNVNKGSITLVVGLNGSTSQTTFTYPQTIRAEGNATITLNNTNVNYTLMRNGSVILTGNTSVSNEPLSNATWNMTFNTSGNANYSASYVEVLAGVNKGSITLVVAVNGSTSTTTFTYPQVIRGEGNATIGLNNTDVNYTLMRNGTVILTGNTSVRNEPLSNASWNFTYNTSGGQNYSASYIEVLANVNKGTITLTVGLNGSTSTTTYTYPQVIRAEGNATITLNNTNVNYTLMRNGSVILTGNTSVRNEPLSNATWNITFNTSGNANYSLSYVEVLASVNKGSQTVTLLVNDTTITDNEPINATAYTSGVNNEGSTTIFSNISISETFTNITLAVTGINKIDISTVNVSDKTFAILAYANQTANYSSNTTYEYITVTFNNAPFITQITPAANGNEIGTSSGFVTLSVGTGETAMCKIDSANVAFGSMAAVMTADSINKTHAAIVAVSENTNTTEYVLCRDTLGNINSNPYILFFTPRIINTLGGGGGGGGGVAPQEVTVLAQLESGKKLFSVDTSQINVLLVMNVPSIYEFKVKNDYDQPALFIIEPDSQIAPYVRFNRTEILVPKRSAETISFTALSTHPVERDAVGNISVFLKGSKIHIDNIGVRVSVVSDASQLGARRITGLVALAGQGRLAEFVDALIRSMGDTIGAGHSVAGQNWEATRWQAFLVLYLVLGGVYYEYEIKRNAKSPKALRHILVFAFIFPVLAGLLVALL